MNASLFPPCRPFRLRFTNSDAALLTLPYPLFILDRCERNVAIGGKSRVRGAFPLALKNCALFLRQFAFGLGLFKRFKRQIQLWCRDLFHGQSVSRSGNPVMRTGGRNFRG